MHRIYLASTLENREKLQPIARQLILLGHQITSRWVFEPEDGLSEHDIAVRDLQDLNAADTLVFWPDEETKRSSGKFVEYGYALGRGKPTYVVDRDSSKCVFLQLDSFLVTYVANWDELLQIFRSL